MKTVRIPILIALAVCLCVASASAQDSLNVRRVVQIIQLHSHAVALSGDYTYVAIDGLGGGVGVIDVSNPVNPVQVGSCPTLTFGAMDVAASGNYVFIARHNDGFGVLDISNPLVPQLVGWYDTPGHADGVTVSGNILYETDYSSLRIYDVSDPTAPTLIGTCPTAQAFRATIKDGYAYIANTNPAVGLTIVDISNPAVPIQVGSFSARGNVDCVDVSGGYACVVCGNGNLAIIDITDPASPFEVGWCYATGTLWRVVVSGGYAFGSGSLGLRVFDIRNPNDPVETGFYAMQGTGLDLKVRGNLAYVIAGSRLSICDFSAAISESPIARGYMELLQPGPPDWGHRLWWIYGHVNRIAFTHFCTGTTGSVSGAAMPNWTVMAGGDGNNGDSIFFVTNVPQDSASLDTFWLSHSVVQRHGAMASRRLLRDDRRPPAGGISGHDRFDGRRRSDAELEYGLGTEQ
jgi:hypothetical protein